MAAMDNDDVAKYLRDNYVFSDKEKKRREKARKRLDLYNDKGSDQINEMVDDLFRNAKVRQLRKKFVEIAQYQNLTKRIVREISSVYSEPATRRVGVSAQNRTYQMLQRRVRLDRRMRLANQMLNLLNEVVVWFDVGLGGPVLRVVTPDNFWAVCHPNDPTHLVALIFDQTPIVPRVGAPHYLVVSDAERFQLDDSGRILPQTRSTLGLSRMPMVLAHKTEPTTQLLSPDPGNDIISAHKAVALLNTMMLKHQKSGTRQAVASGDLGDMPSGQPMDEEHVIQSPEGVTWSTLDLGADPKSYIDATRAVIKQLAANHGIPESVFDLSYQATSGFEIELKRTGLREVRRDQILDWRPLEFELAEVMSEVLTEARHEMRFAVTGWSIDFGEVETPQDPMQRLAYWRELQRMGLMSKTEMYMLMNPEATEDEANEQIMANIIINNSFVVEQRALNVPFEAAVDGSGDEDDEREAVVQ